MIEVLSKSLEETENLAKVFVKKLLPKENSATVVALSGDLGSGKTTFTQIVARLLGVKEKITSPTFVIMKRFMIHDSGFKNLVHIDAYRLKGGEELKKLGWDEMIADPRNLIFIEWPENVASALPENILRINFEFVDENTRKLSY